ncbi:alpha/beta hydrolase [Gordonia sp. HY002]|uniref:alpha/beta hydrolase family protein n=1 Tax=Gordonia zhenghanii TaxID=2911516 RepID=UPI001EF0AA9C|nr:alpha/beta hydrolase [Gordonia zhenghanii]MCF8570938.1 alpha/beta hydrolase [Gordonia zhenghanii]MCF8607009.1 alpha/beta hydrolase [Gordonia zhenghanii]
MRRIKIPYGDAPSTYGHLYLPAETARGDGPAPLVVLIHGGYWSTEYSLVVYTGLARLLAQRGAVVWNVEYRRVGEEAGGWPTTGRDVVDALSALDGPVSDQLATADITVDHAHAAVVGHSAGGQLAVYSAARLGGATRRFTFGTVIAQSPVLDFTETGAFDRPSVVDLMGAPFAQIPDRYREASPSEQEPFDSTVAVIHTVGDQSMPIAMSRRYVADATVRGQSAVLYEVPGEGHDAFVDPKSAATRQTLRVLGI